MSTVEEVLSDYELISESSGFITLDSNVAMFQFEFTYPHRGTITVKQWSFGCLKYIYFLCGNDGLWLNWVYKIWLIPIPTTTLRGYFPLLNSTIRKVAWVGWNDKTKVSSPVQGSEMGTFCHSKLLLGIVTEILIDQWFSTGVILSPQVTFAITQRYL